MPNWMSDEDLALENGDKRTCEHCHKAYWVDEWHSCPEGHKSSQEATEAFNNAYFGDGTTVTHKITITVTGPNTESAFDTGRQMAEIFGEDGSDPVLGISWTYKKETL